MTFSGCVQLCVRLSELAKLLALIASSNSGDRECGSIAVALTECTVDARIERKRGLDVINRGDRRGSFLSKMR